MSMTIVIEEEENRLGKQLMISNLIFMTVNEKRKEVDISLYWLKQALRNLGYKLIVRTTFIEDITPVIEWFCEIQNQEDIESLNKYFLDLLKARSL